MNGAESLLTTLINNRREVGKLIGDLVLGKKTKTSMRTNQREKSVTLTVSGLSLAPMVLLGAAYFMGSVPMEHSGPVPVEALPPPPPPQKP